MQSSDAWRRRSFAIAQDDKIIAQRIVGTIIKKILDKYKQITENICVPGVPGVFTCAGWDVGQWQFAVFSGQLAVAVCSFKIGEIRTKSV